MKTYKNKNGYLYTWFDGKYRTAHRVVWKLHHGNYPENDIDHINGIRDDNRIENLREVTRSQNLMNQTSRHDLPKNVYKRGERFRVKMKINGETKHFGYFDDLEFAELVAREVQDKFHGQYARA